MDDDIDTMMKQDWLAPPAHFAQRVMNDIAFLPLPAHRPGPLERLQQAVLIAGGLAGIVQLAAFMFGIWAASTAT